MTRRHVPRTFDEVERERFPLSATFHDATKLDAPRLLELAERTAAAPSEAPPRKVYPTRPAIELARSRRAWLGSTGRRFDDVVRARRSARGTFAAGSVPARDVGALLDLALGETGGGLRAFPSAGGLYPLETYVAALACEGIEPGLYHHDPAQHLLRTLAECPSREELGRLIVGTGEDGEDRWDRAALALIFTAVFERTQAKYGERGYRFVHLEAGHAAQNVLLAASALGLAAVPLGGFCEDALGDRLGLDPAVESPVHVVLLGRA